MQTFQNKRRKSQNTHLIQHDQYSKILHIFITFSAVKYCIISFEQSCYLHTMLFAKLSSCDVMFESNENALKLNMEFISLVTQDFSNIFTCASHS
jgi:hypothetical protein